MNSIKAIKEIMIYWNEILLSLADNNDSEMELNETYVYSIRFYKFVLSKA